MWSSRGSVVNNIGEAHIKRNDGRKMILLSMVVKRRNDGVRKEGRLVKR